MEMNAMSKATNRYTNVSKSIEAAVAWAPTRKGELTLPNATLRLGDHARPGSIVPSKDPNTYTREQFLEWYDLSTEACERLGAGPQSGGLAAQSWSFKQAIDRPHTVGGSSDLAGSSVIGFFYAACHLQECYAAAEKRAAVGAAVLEGTQVYVNSQPARKDGTLIAHATLYDAVKYVLRQDAQVSRFGKTSDNPAHIKGVSMGSDWHAQIDGEGKLEQRVMNNTKLMAKVNKHISIGAPKAPKNAPKMSTISNSQAVSMAKEAGAPTSVTTGTGCSARSKTFLVNNGLISSE